MFNHNLNFNIFNDLKLDTLNDLKFDNDFNILDNLKIDIDTYDVCNMDLNLECLLENSTLDLNFEFIDYFK